ncbi:MAG: hypothetical protein IJN80_06450 [Clostridia bacterium]|nr:hypothetical protein [Clostridia bacterium]
MSKKKLLTILCCALAVIVALVSFAATKDSAGNDKSDAEKMREMADREE